MAPEVAFGIYVLCGAVAIFTLGYFVGTIQGEDRSNRWWRHEWERKEARR